MLGPVDLDDWAYDERDMLSALLRRHDAVHAIVTGADAGATAFPKPLRKLVCRFARQDLLPMADLHRIAEALPATPEKRRCA